MKILVKQSSENPVTLLRRIGYVFQRRDGEETSFVRTFGRSDFPRFHCYTKQENDGLLISIHLDRKRETYGTSTRHHGEYDDEGPLSEEVRRIMSSLGSEAHMLP